MALVSADDTRVTCAPLADEDEGFKAALNIDNSVARLGFYGPQGSKLWVTSGTETFHLWEWAAACSDEAEGEALILSFAAEASPRVPVHVASSVEVFCSRHCPGGQPKWQAWGESSWAVAMYCYFGEMLTALAREQAGGQLGCSPRQTSVGRVGMQK